MGLFQGTWRNDGEEVWTRTLVLCTVPLLARPSFLPSGGSRRPCKQILFEMKATIPLFPLIDLACRSGNKGCFDPSTLSDHHQ
jgi:hypothetical protein